MSQLPQGVDLWQIPCQAPPPGVIPSFTKRSRLLDFTIAISALFLPLMLLFFGIRVYIRLNRRNKWMIDDSVALATTIACLCFSGLILTRVQGLARHSWDISLGYYISAETQKIVVAQFFLNSISLWLGKLCLLTMYWRIFGHVRKVRWQIYGVAIFTLPIFAAIFVQAALVWPADGKPWGAPNPRIEKALIPGLMVRIDNLIVDILIAYIPIPIIATLKLWPSKKNGVIILFATGGIAVITDILTLYFQIGLYLKQDQLLYGYIAYNCAIIEACISIILSSLPCTAKLFRVHIEPSQILRILRSHLSIRKSNRDSTVHRELPTFINEGGSPPEQRRDPHKIGMPTTHVSGISL